MSSGAFGKSLSCTDRRADGHNSIDFPIYKDPEYIYFMESQMNIVEITHGMTNLYIPFSTCGEGYKNKEKN